MWYRTDSGGVGVAFTDVSDGNLAAHTGDEPAQVARRRRRVEQKLGTGLVRYAWQVHGTAVLDVTGTASDATDLLAAPEADAVVSADGTPVGILTADCLPVVLVGRRAGGVPVLAVAHAGRPGLLAGVLQETVAAVRAHGALDLEAWIGPAVCGACYEVPTEMAQQAEEALPGVATTTSWGTDGLDLPGAARSILEDHGVRVREETADRAAWCTLEHDELYSYRRDKTPGRLAGLVWVSEEGGRDA